MSFWNGLHIVVTGGAGMIGVPLVRLLLERGAHVRVLDDFSRGFTRVPDAGYMEGDAADYETCKAALQGADGLLNLAAEVGGVAYNQTRHSEMFTRNLMLQAVPLVVAERLSIRTVQVSSVCIYAPEYACPAIEHSGSLGKPHRANFGYAMAKRFGERLCLGKDQIVRVRPSNSYGPLDYYGERAHVVPALIQRAHTEGHHLTLMGTGYETREFIFSEDVARGIAAAFEYGRSGSVYNLGTDGQTATNIMGLARLVIQMVTGRMAELTFDTSKGGGDSERCTDSHKALNDLRWRYEVALEEGLERTIADYRKRFVT
jgi:nucleoside-diphosphate-sugar epimerase